ncbi:MAG: response regulator transcription factor [Elainellaceae cyanobacterium]
MKKILVVDDDITLRTALAHYLEKRGYCVQLASSGREAIASFNDDLPDLVVSDVLMPEMDGLEFCKQIRSIRQGQLMPFIFLSTRDKLDDRIEGHQTGADDYLVKPFEPRELLAKIEALLERSRRIHSEIVNLMQQVAPAAPPPQAVEVSPPPLPLTPAESKVFWEVVQGYTNKQAADRLFLSPRTIQTHLSNILNKLQLENRSQLVRFAFEQGYELPSSDYPPVNDAPC